MWIRMEVPPSESPDPLWGDNECKLLFKKIVLDNIGKEKRFLTSEIEKIRFPSMWKLQKCEAYFASTMIGKQGPDLFYVDQKIRQNE